MKINAQTDRQIAIGRNIGLNVAFKLENQTFLDIKIFLISKSQNGQNRTGHFCYAMVDRSDELNMYDYRQKDLEMIDKDL